MTLPNSIYGVHEVHRGSTEDPSSIKVEYGQHHSRLNLDVLLN
jgi:hypothetical protein